MRTWGVETAKYAEYANEARSIATKNAENTKTEFLSLCSLCSLWLIPRFPFRVFRVVRGLTFAALVKAAVVVNQFASDISPPHLGRGHFILRTGQPVRG